MIRLLFFYYRPDISLNTSNQALTKITISMELLQNSSEAEEATMPVLVPEPSISQKRQLSRASKRRFSIESAESGASAVKKRKNDGDGEVLKAPFFKLVEVQGFRKMVKNMIVFTRDDPKLCYEYSLRDSTQQTYYCQRCQQQGVHVRLRLFKNTPNGGCVKLSPASHLCEPQIYDPSKYVEISLNVSTSQLVAPAPSEVDEDGQITLSNNMAAIAEVPVTKAIPENAEKLTDFQFDTFTTSDGSKIKHLTIINPEKKDVCYNFYYHASNHVYQCIECHRLSKYVYIKLYRNEANELFFEYGNNGHVCFPQPVPLTIEAANFKIKKDANVQFKNLTIFTSDSREFCYHYFWNIGNRFRCRRCLKQKSCVVAKLYQKETGEYYVKMNHHICEPIRYSESNDTPE